MMKLRSGEGRRSWTGFYVLMGAAFIGSFFFGRSAEPVSREPAAAQGSQKAAPGAGQGRSAAAAGELGDVELEERAADLQREIDGLERLAQAYEDELYGTAIPWPEDVAEPMSPEGYRAGVVDAIESCGAPVDLVSFDCSEPPCFALLRSRGVDWRQALINNCPAWNETYGTTTSGASFRVECDDGSTEEVEMLGVPLKQVLGADAEIEAGNPMKRLQARMTEQQLRWTCAGEGE